jgi:antagonist of KipI
MGYRLNAVPLQTLSTEEVISSAVTMGTLQLLPDGKLILLMADHQTTGGYPRIAHIITAHHTLLAQMKTGDQIHFRFTDQQTAEDLMIRQQQHLQQLQYACTLKLQDYEKAVHPK